MNPLIEIIAKKGFSLSAILQSLSDPAVLSGVLQGFITGLMAIGAGLFTLVSFLNERKRKNQTEFIQWLATLTEKYQGNAKYSEIRTILARDRTWVRRVLCLEMTDDGLFDIRKEALKEDIDWLEENAAKPDEQLDWDFLKNLTDYLYFFEQVLAFGGALKSINSKESARAIVNHFGWFLRSLCFAWSGGDAPTRMKAAGIFARYLAYNRYRRLAEVSLCFMETFASSEKDPFIKTKLMATSEEQFERVRFIFHEDHGDKGFPDSIKALFKRWSPLVGSIGTIRH